MTQKNMIDDLLEGARQSSESISLGASLASASLRLERIIDRMISARSDNG